METNKPVISQKSCETVARLKAEKNLQPTQIVQKLKPLERVAASKEKL